MLRKVNPLAPMVVSVTLSAVPVVLLMVLGFTPVVTLTVPPPVALKPMPLVVSISSPTPLKLIVPPSLLSRLTAVSALVFNVLVPPLKFTVPEFVPLFVTSMPSQVAVQERLPERLAVPVS